MDRPSKNDMTKLMEDLQEWQRLLAKLTQNHSAPLPPDPHPPHELSDRARIAAEAYDLPNTAQWAKDSHRRDVADVIVELGNLREKL
jgi:hypothetical protein